MTEPRRKLRVPELDGWRAVSVFLVLLHHLFAWQFPFALAGIPYMGHVLFFAGPLGVRIFFVISGFVICRLLIAEEESNGFISLKAFYYRRSFRILPPFLVFMAVVAILFASGLLIGTWGAQIKALLFVSDFQPVFPMWFVAHCWSLGVEQQFYLVFPLAWVLAPARWRNRLFFAILALCILWNQALHYPGWLPSIPSGITRVGFVCICCGVLLAINEERVRILAARIPAIVVALFGILLLIHPVVNKSNLAVLFDGGVEPALIGLILMYSLVRGPILKTVLCSRPFQAIGLTSYGIYLWQQLFTSPSENYAGAGKVIPYLLPAIFIIVPTSYYLIEKPALRLGKALSARTRKADAKLETVTD